MINSLHEIYEGVRSFLEMGGWVMTYIFLTTLLMWILIIERFIFYRFFLPKEAKKRLEAWNARRDKTSWQAAMIRRLEVSQLSQSFNQSIPMIRTLIALCPLLGLLGTVTGMIEVFNIMAIVGSGNARAMASGISMATIPTMSGLVAALSGMYFMYRLDMKAKQKVGQVKEAMAV